MDITLATTVAAAVKRRDAIANLVADMRAALADSPFGSTTLFVPRAILPEFIRVAETALEEVNETIKGL